MSVKLKFIDISNWQKSVDYQKVKNDGIQGVILRVGHTGSANKSMDKDLSFEKHYQGFKSVGLPIGVYWFSRATNASEAIKEANLTLQYLGDKELQLPIFWDTEDNVYQNKISRELLTDVAIIYLEHIKKYRKDLVGVYASTSWLNNRLNMSRLSHYEVWVAQYNTYVTYKGRYDIWQFTSQAKVNGIVGGVDMNWCYKDYLNTQTPTEPIYKPIGSDLVVNGIWDKELTKLLQILFKTTVDSIISGQTIGSWNINVQGMKSGLFGSQLIRAIQKWLGIKINGKLDKPTIIALQKKMGTTVDGFISKDSQMVRELKRRIKEGTLL